jgi:Fur family transcriptional regulator, zinc uptake regulator
MPTQHHHTKALQSAEEICRRVGARLTRLRRSVFELVLSAERPLTAYEILDLLRPKDTSATPAGVYRSLDFLSELGLVHRIESAKSFVACAMPDHVHPSQMLVCRRCGTIETEDSQVAKAAESLGRRLGFALDRRTMELTVSVRPVEDEPRCRPPAPRTAPSFDGSGKGAPSRLPMRRSTPRDKPPGRGAGG